LGKTSATLRPLQLCDWSYRHLLQLSEEVSTLPGHGSWMILVVGFTLDIEGINIKKTSKNIEILRFSLRFLVTNLRDENSQN